MESLPTHVRVHLGVFPTPVEPLPRLTAELGGPQLLVKRDDLTGLALGGNKVRKLEYILGDALERRCDVVVTAGAAQSNHCRQTAAAAARLGLPCHLLLGGAAPAEPMGNLLLDHLFGATLHWCGEHRKGEDIPALVNDLEARGMRPCVVPYGGSNTLGTLGFVQAAAEFAAQPEADAIDHIVVASSSGATQAGLALGAHMHGLRAPVTGIAIDKAEIDGQTLGARVQTLVTDTATLLGVDPGPVAIDLRDDWCGAGYATVTAAEREAILLAARLEGLLLDPVYTGRAMAGLMALARATAWARDARVLFWHTGGTPALFAHARELLADP